MAHGNTELLVHCRGLSTQPASTSIKHSRIDDMPKGRYNIAPFSNCWPRVRFRVWIYCAGSLDHCLGVHWRRCAVRHLSVLAGLGEGVVHGVDVTGHEGHFGGGGNG